MMNLFYFRRLILWLGFMSYSGQSFVESRFLLEQPKTADTVRVSAYNFPPFFTIKQTSNGSYQYGGISPELVEIMETYLHTKALYVHVRKSEVDEFGLIKTFFRQMDRGEVDVVPYFFDFAEETLKHAAIGFPVADQQLVLLQLWPLEESRLKVTIRPFSLTVWMLVLASLVAFVATRALLAFVDEYRRNEVANPALYNVVYGQLEYALTTIAAQGNSVDYTAPLSFRLVTSAWLLAIVVLVPAYSGVLTSLLTVPKLEHTMDSFDDIVSRDGIRVTMEEETPLTRNILAASSGPYKVVGDKWRKDPKKLFFTDIPQMLDNVLHKDCVYPGTRLLIRFLISADLKLSGSCRMTISSRALPDYYGFYIIGISKGSPFNSMGNFNLTMRLVEGGLPTFMVRKYIPSGDDCRADIPPESKTQPLKFEDLSPSFVILGFGLGISTLVFCLENIVGRRATMAPLTV